MTAASEPEALIAAARAGDQRAYARLVEPHRQVLRAHCYRMLGSLHDAEDALQDALLSAWQGMAGFEGRSALRTWLYTVATRACLHMTAQRPRRVLPAEHGPAADPRDQLPAPLEEALWLEPYPDDGLGDDGQGASPEARYQQLEGVELAFIAALQQLAPNQRAVLILRDVLGLSALEAAAALDTTVASATSALQRARRTLAQRLPGETQQAARRALGDDGHQRLVTRFVDAWTRADVDGIVALLAEDASFSMPPLPCWFRGAGDIRTFLVERVFQLRWRFRPAHANGQPAIAAYQWSAETRTFRLDVLNVLDVVSAGGGRVAAITSFLSHDLGRRFGLPVEIPG